MAASSGSEDNSSILLKVLGGVGILIILGAITNPPVEKHRSKIDEMVGANILSNILGKEELTSSRVSYNDYNIGSTTTFKGKVVTIGVAGQVFMVVDTGSQDQN